MSYLDRIREANSGHGTPHVPFRIGQRTFGRMRPEAAGLLAKFGDVFVHRPDGLALKPKLEVASCKRRSSAVAEVMQELRAVGHLPTWRNEHFAVRRHFEDPPEFLIERAAIALLGVRGWGVHLNGYLERDGELLMWIGKRSQHKPTWPGQLDQLVAGGQPARIGVKANLLKECQEEAGIEPALAATAIPTGAISYCCDSDLGIHPDVVFTFDLRLPGEFVPRNVDGEVEAFYLWPLSQVAKVIEETTAFKFNCALVIIDFLLRHEFISPEESGYLKIVKGLRTDPLSL